jgi:transposase
VTVSSETLTTIGVGIDTARYGHRVSFLRPDRQPAAKPLTVLENQDGHTALRERLEQLHQQHPQAHFHVRVDAAGQYAMNLERFLRSLPLPMTISIGEPKRNKDYQKAHFPKRTSDDTESQAMARFAVVEQPKATPASPAAMDLLREVAGRLQAQVKQSTQAINRLHNLLARVFPELATLTKDIAAGWVLQLLDKYPTAPRIAQARLSSLEKIPYLPQEKAGALHQAAQRSVGSLQGDLAEELVRELVAQLRHCQAAEHKLRQLLLSAHSALPSSGHVNLTSIPGIGAATAAVLTAKITNIDRFETPEDLVGYFGIFPQEASSGVDPQGQPLPQATMHMSHKGNDLVRAYLYNAAFSAVQHNPAVRALYRRLRARGKRSDVAMGHCMRKLLHLVFAVWKTNKPFDPHHYPWESDKASTAADSATAPNSAIDKAVGHKREQVPTEKVVTTAPSSVSSAAPAVNTAPVVPTELPTPSGNTPPRPSIDFAFLRSQISLEQLLRHLGLFDSLNGRAPQLRGCCPFHEGDRRRRTFSVHLGKNVFHCFDADCQAQGNALDFWAAYRHLPIYEAALDLAVTFHLPRNREEAPVQEPVPTRCPTGRTSAVITANEP